MNHEINTEIDKPWIERTDHSADLLGIAFGRVIDHPSVNSILDVGAGDSDFARAYTATGKQVARVDADYANHPPEGGDWSSDDVRDLQAADESYDSVVSAYMMQHLNPKAQTEALEEMIRVVKPANGYVGYVGIFPVYDQNAVNDLLQERGLDKFAKAIRPDSEQAQGAIGLKKHLRSVATLWIEKSDAFDVQMQSAVIEAIVDSEGLNRRLTWRDKRRAARMAITSSNKFHGQA